MEKTERKAGILLGVASLPGNYGIGDFGKGSYRFVDDLAKAGFSLWQILPLAPLGYGHSPYQPYSSFAMDEIYLDLDALHEEGLIGKPAPFNALASKIAYEEVRAYKLPYLRAAYKAEKAKNPRLLTRFKKEHPWASDYSVFIAFHESHQSSWDNWPLEERDWILTRPALKGKMKEEADFRLYLQYKLYQQWDKLHAYAKDKGIEIIGDLPFYVGFDSCDVWANQDTFLLDRKTKQPSFIAGVPPDYFSATGQRWGNPIYDWKKLAKEDFSFIENRIALNARIYDVLRLDHFRAFDTYWKIPSSCPTAVEGEWVEAPGYALFDSLLAKYPSLNIIAEDLGDLRPEVLTLRDHYDFPGMNVIEFTFHDYEIEHKGKWDEENAVAYLGTHDNETIVGFFYDLDEREQAEWVYALEQKGIAEGPMNERLIRYCFAKKAKYALVSMQDVLGLDKDARTNVPSTVNDVNWTWKMSDFASFEEKLPSLEKVLKEEGRSAL